MILSVQLINECINNCKGCYLKQGTMLQSNSTSSMSALKCINSFNIDRVYMFFNPVTDCRHIDTQDQNGIVIIDYCKSEKIGTISVVNGDIAKYHEWSYPAIRMSDEIAISTTAANMHRDANKVRTALDVGREKKLTALIPIDENYKKVEQNHHKYTNIQYIWFKPKADVGLMIKITDYVSSLSFDNPNLRMKILLDTCMQHVILNQPPPCRNQVYVHSDGTINRCPYICTILGRKNGTINITRCPMRLEKE